MENYLQQLDKLNQLVDIQRTHPSFWSFIHQYSGVILVVGLLLLIISYIALSALYRVTRHDSSGGVLEGMLFVGVFFVIGLAGISDKFIYSTVTPAYEQLGITEDSYTTIQNTITDMPDDEYNTLIEGEKVYKLTEKQQEEYKTVLTILNSHKR